MLVQNPMLVAAAFVRTHKLSMCKKANSDFQN